MYNGVFLYYITKPNVVEKRIGTENLLLVARIFTFYTSEEPFFHIILKKKGYLFPVGYTKWHDSK